MTRLEDEFTRKTKCLWSVKMMDRRQPSMNSLISCTRKNAARHSSSVIPLAAPMCWAVSGLSIRWWVASVAVYSLPAEKLEPCGLFHKRSCFLSLRLTNAIGRIRAARSLTGIDSSSSSLHEYCQAHPPIASWEASASRKSDLSQATKKRVVGWDMKLEMVLRMVRKARDWAWLSCILALLAAGRPEARREDRRAWSGSIESANPLINLAM